MHSTAALLPLYTSSSIITKSAALTIDYPANAKHSSHKKAGRNNVPACRASGSSRLGSAITDYNLYELLGVDNFSDRSQIKEAYRALQKRCHPDIAGPPGHDMAIVLNEAYALLSDPLSRMAYDKELLKVADFQGYTGKPLYSVWLGSETEQRAAFVDEVKCVGCLKCALFAAKTFAVESMYGRARVVAQWADPEEKIQEAIDACPVDCITYVERSDLPAFEFIMSKQPRGKVRIGVGNTVGARTVDIFNAVEKFQARYSQHTGSMESESESASSVSAIRAIQMISNWWYWQSPITDAMPPATQDLTTAARKHSRPNIKMLKAAAAAREQAETSTTPPEGSVEYWMPSSLVLPEATTIPDLGGSKPAFNPTSTRKINRTKQNELFSRNKGVSNPFRWGVPLATATVAAVVTRLQIGEPVGGLKDHIGGPIALAIVNSSWFQVSLAGVTWYVIAMYLVELVEGLRRK